MKDLVQDIRRLWDSGEPFALALVTGTWSSAPRSVGAAMMVDSSGRAYGSVSGGCVEGALYDECRAALISGEHRRLRYGVSDGDAFSVGLTCGGEISLAVFAIDPARDVAFETAIASLESDVAVALIISVDAPLQLPMVLTATSVAGSTGHELLDHALVDDARGYLSSGRNGVIHLGAEGERREDEVGYQVITYKARSRMYVFGAIDFAKAVAEIGVFLGFHTTVVDARSTFATRERFPAVDEVVVDWPHRFLANAPIDSETVICVLTHDPKFDVPVLIEALDSPAAYIGVMGSRRTHERRLAELQAAGVRPESLERLHAPIGLDLGARTPEETAISIAAEIIKARWGGTGQPLSMTDGPIHR